MVPEIGSAEDQRVASWPGALRRAALLTAAVAWGWCLAVLVGWLAAEIMEFGGPESRVVAFSAFFGAVALGPFALLEVTSHLRSVLCVFTVGALLGGWTFIAFMGEGVRTSWVAAADHPAHVEAVGDWVANGLVVRARQDVVVAYRLDNGTVAWRWSPPSQYVVCAVARHTSAGIGLIGYGPQSDDGSLGGCGGVAALNLATGRSLWTTKRSDPPLSDPGDQLIGLDVDAAPDTLDVVGSTAVLQEGTGWRGLRLADGTSAWRTAAGDDCVPLRLAAGTTRVIAVSQCGASTRMLASLSAADGRVQWRTALPSGGKLDNLAVLAVDPVVVWINDSSTRGTHAVLSYDADGHALATIPMSTSTGDLELPLGAFGSPAFGGRPVYGAVVVNGLLIATADQPGDIRLSRDGRGSLVRDARGHLVAYSLHDGQLQWTAGLGDHPEALSLDGNTVWTLTSDTLVGTDAATGRRVHTVKGDGLWQTSVADLWHARNAFVVVQEDGTESLDADDPPVRVLR